MHAMTSGRDARASLATCIRLAGCAWMLVVFAALSWKAAQTKSPGVDEPLDVLGAWVTRQLGDFRVNYEDPPLWHYWAAIGQSDVAADLNLTSSWWPQALHNTAARFAWIKETFNQPQGHWIERVRRSRAMMVVLGVALAAAIGFAGSRVGGPPA